MTRGGEACAVATDTVDGGERRARGCEREGSRGERSRQGGSERGSGVSWRRGRRPGRRWGSQAGKEELARLACASGTQLLRGEGRKTTEGLQCWAESILLGHQAGGPQVSVG